MTSLPKSRLQQALGAGYSIERELAPGGMSHVFLATDRSLERRVVVKVLPPELTSQASAARFKREIALSAHLNHPHILPVLSAGSDGELLYYVTPYSEGESLRVRIAREGPLPINESLSLLCELADALSYAHRHGVIHRDVKPANILLHEGHAILLDFGVACALEAARSGDSITKTSAFVGTPGYMSPEQIGGGSQVDERADLYALAVVGFEMFAGAPPFDRPTVQGMIAAHLNEAPPVLRERRRDVPAHVGHAIMKGLSKLPSERFATVAEFRDALADGGGLWMRNDRYVRVARVEDVAPDRCTTVSVEGHQLALFRANDAIYAVEDRCPHMGFPLHRGTVADGVLTCHWHHARFDLASGGTFDPWADDVRAFPVSIRDDQVWVDMAPRVDPRAHARTRLRDGLERRIPLVIAKAVIQLAGKDAEAAEASLIALNFGTHFRRNGWGQGLTIHTCMVNLMPQLRPEDRPRALLHGLSAVAADCHGSPPRFPVKPLPTLAVDPAMFKLWFRRYVEVRDAEGAERCIASAVRSGARPDDLAGMLFAAATDHRYIRTGHVLDFTNKALEALDSIQWAPAETEAVLTSLVTGYADAERMEESNAWRNPVDVVAILESAFESLPSAVEEGSRVGAATVDQERLATIALGDDPGTIADALLSSLREGVPGETLAGAVAQAAILRIARFHTSNEFGDWDTALHTFSFANAVHQGMRRSPSTELLRGVFDAAMSVYLDRFLNVPAARLPERDETFHEPEVLLRDLSPLLDRQQQVDAAGELIGRYLFSDGDPDPLLASLGGALLREDRDFHTIQMMEGAFRQYERQRGTPAGAHALVAAARYLAAHAPTLRAQGQTWQIARRLSRGERLFEAPERVGTVGG